MALRVSGIASNGVLLSPSEVAAETITPAAAATGRTQSRVVQAGSLPRPILPSNHAEQAEHQGVDRAKIQMLGAGHGRASRGRISNSTGASMVTIHLPRVRCSGLQS